MSKGYKITMWVLMALTVVTVIVDCKMELYKDAFYQGVQFLWLGLLYYATCGWSKASEVNKAILNECEQTTRALHEANQREEIARKTIADLRKRLKKAKL